MLVPNAFLCRAFKFVALLWCENAAVLLSLDSVVKLACVCALTQALSSLTHLCCLLLI